MYMQLVARLFNATIVADDGAVPVWDPSVRFFRVYRDGQPKGHLYIDPYARPGGEHHLARGFAVPQLPNMATHCRSLSMSLQGLSHSLQRHRNLFRP